jgi:meromycolic acid enoyl-[acyl-carrier protein] reductase
VILEGKRILVTGVADRHSIAYSVAEQAQHQGAEVLLTSFGRMRRITERAAATLPEPPDVLELDVGKAEDFEALREELQRRWGHLDGVLHAVAFAPPDAIGGDFLATPSRSAIEAFEVSAFSLKALAEGLLPLLEASDGIASVVGLDFDARVAWPSYDWMGVAKAALESVARYLARDLGPRGIRVNLVAAGPLRTMAASGIDDFEGLLAQWLRRAPLGWDATDSMPVAEAVAFMLSDLSRAISGEVLHVDGGVHAMGGDLADGPVARD